MGVFGQVAALGLVAQECDMLVWLLALGRSWSTACVLAMLLWYCWRNGPTMTIFSRYNPRLLWETISMSEDNLGEVGIDPASSISPVDDRMISMVTQSEDWTQQLLAVFRLVGLHAIADHYESKLLIKRGRRRAHIKLLEKRDFIFDVRNRVRAKIGSEAIRDHTEANRLVVSRHVGDVLQQLNVSYSTRDIIYNACINACFMDTMYNASGDELLLGPPRRRV